MERFDFRHFTFQNYKLVSIVQVGFKTLKYITFGTNRVWFWYQTVMPDLNEGFEMSKKIDWIIFYDFDKDHIFLQLARA